MKSLFYIICLSSALLLSACSDSSEPNSIHSKGFQPNPNGFSFANDGNFTEADFSESVLASWYGVDNVCYNNQLDNCAITAYGAYQRSNAIKTQSNGQCYGFAAGSAMLYYGGIPFEGKSMPAEFNPAANHAYDLTRTDAGRLIAAKSANQYTQGVRDLIQQCMQGDMLPQYNKLKASFAQTSQDPIAILTIFDIYGGNGHAVTPYKVEENGDTAKIYVYDNNYPGNDQLTFDLDLVKNTWVYDYGKVNADAGYVYPYRSQNNQNPFCSVPLSLTADSTIVNQVPDNYAQIQLNGGRQMDVGISNAQDQIQGYDFYTQQHLSQIPNAKTIKRFDGLSPVYQIPIESNLSDLETLNTAEDFERYFEEAILSLFGALPQKTERDAVSLSMETQSPIYKSALVINDLSVGPGDLMSVAFHPRGRFLWFEKETASDDLPLINLFFDDLNAKEGARHRIKLTSELPVGVSFAVFIDAYDVISIFLVDSRDDTSTPLEKTTVTYQVASHFLDSQGETKLDPVEQIHAVGSAYRFHLTDKIIEQLF